MYHICLDFFSEKILDEAFLLSSCVSEQVDSSGTELFPFCFHYQVCVFLSDQIIPLLPSFSIPSQVVYSGLTIRQAVCGIILLSAVSAG